MSSNPKTENEIECLVDVEYELEQDTNAQHINVIIKHDYYSSDTEHGRLLLHSYLNSLIASAATIENVFLIDSGVKLSCNNEDLANLIKCCSVDSVYASKESLSFYKITSSIRITEIEAIDIFNMINWLLMDGDTLVVIE